MSYHVTVANKYREAIKAFGTILNANETRKFSQAFGNGVVEVFGLGPINFTDIGKKDLGGHSKAAWGVLLSYQGEEVVFRYEGGGELQVTISDIGQAELSGNGEFSKVPLPSFTFKKKEQDNVISGNT
jgi:hypothetical protein